MVTDPPPRLVTVLILTAAIHVTLTAAIPKLRPAYEESGSDAEDQTKFDTTPGDQNHLIVLETETTEGKEPVFIDLSYSDGRKNQREKTDDTDRFSYRIIDSFQGDAGKSAVVQVNDDSKNGKAGKEKQKPSLGREESGGSVLQQDVRRQVEFEENVPGFHNWPKHMPENLRPVSPFDDDDRFIAKPGSFIPSRQKKRDYGFVPTGEKFLPPPRAGPYLYPESVINREFGVPYN